MSVLYQQTRNFIYTLFLGLFLLGITARADAKTSSVTIPEAPKPVTLDGVVDDPAWMAAKVLPLSMSQPIHGGDPTGKPLVKIMYSDEALYVAGTFLISEGQAARQLTRDDLDYSSDLFGLVIDGYNDEENAYVFITSPSGNKTDLAISNDGESPKNFNWDTFWTVKVDKQHSNWSFEMRIPLNSIQYQRQDGKVLVGLSVWSYKAGNNEYDTYPLISNEYGTISYFKPSQAADFQFMPSKIDHPLFVSPYLLIGYDHRTFKSDNTNSDLLLDAGLDAKYKLSSNFTLDATINTDFAQVESDDQQINLSRFALYRDEKRAFFQERAGLFSFNTGGSKTMFYSRRIGLTDDGRQIPLYGGLRLTGRANGWDVGVLSMQSAPEHGLESENLGVFRIRKSLDKESSSYAGFMSTSRIGVDGTYNVAYGADMVWEAPRDVYFTGRYAHALSNTNSPGYTAGWLNNTTLFLSAERRSYVGFFYNLTVNRVGKDYNPKLGFVDRRNFTRIGDRIAYGWVAPKSSVLQKYQVVADGYIYFGNSTGEWESSMVSVKNYTELKSGLSFQLGYKRRTERLYDGFSLSPEVHIPAGTYDFGELFVNISTSEGQVFRLTGTGNVGEFYDGRGLALTLSPEWSLSSSLQLSSDLEYYNISFGSRNQHYQSLLVRGRLDFKPTSRISVSGLTQYNNLTEIFSSFARLRFNIVAGSDLFLVYKHGQNSSPLERLSRTDFTSLHSIQAKFSYTFTY